MKTGRPPLYNERMQVHYVGLPPSMADDIAVYGDGNIGRGVRKLWTEHQQRLQQHAQQLKAEQTKAWERDWRSNPTASDDPPHVVISEPGQELLPPPDDPTTPESALTASRYVNRDNEDDTAPGLCEQCRRPFEEHEPVTHECPDPRVDSGAREAIALTAHVFECTEQRPCGRVDCGDCMPF